VKLSKFFKISLLILIVFIGLLIAGAVSFNNYLNEHNSNVENFKSIISDDYWEYSIVDFNKAGDFYSGFKYLNKAVELEPIKHLGYRGWIRLRKIRDFDNALIDFDRLDSLTPNVVDAPWGEDIDFLRGECHFGNKDYNQAIQMFNRNIENNGEGWVDIQTFVYLGLCEYELGNYEKAISNFETALKQSEYTPESHFGIAKCYKKLEQIKKVKESILKAELNINYKRDDIYNEFINEIYLSEIIKFKQELEK